MALSVATGARPAQASGALGPYVIFLPPGPTFASRALSELSEGFLVYYMGLSRRAEKRGPGNGG